MNIITSSSSQNIGTNDFVYEILCKLPVKTLVRFKCVSKKWCSLIHSSHMLILVPALMPLEENDEDVFITETERPPLLEDNWPCFKEFYFYITADLMLFEEMGTTQAVVHSVKKIDSSWMTDISNPVNGLICLISLDYEYAIRTFNITSHELSPWFNSPLFPGNNHKFGFGFDPSTNEHKLVCVSEPHQNSACRFDCAVLTVVPQDDNNRWRRIDDTPPFELTNDSVYVNGVIYWSTFGLKCGRWDTEFRPLCIVSFDVTREKFGTITVPDFILDQHEVASDFPGRRRCIHPDRLCNLLQLDGRLAMIIKVNNHLFKMFTYEDDDAYDGEINGASTSSSSSSSSNGSFSSTNNGRWNEVTSIILPFNLTRYHCLKFFNFSGSDDKIILRSTLGKICDRDVGKKKCVSLHCHNWKKGVWAEVELSGMLPSSVPHLCFRSSLNTFS